MHNLGRMHPVRAGEFVDRFESFEGFQRHPGCALGAGLFPLCRQCLSPHLLHALPLTQQGYLKDLSSFWGTLWRRAFIRDKAQAYWRRMEKFISQTARDARQRTYGLIAETQPQIREANVPEDAVLVARVRAQIGHVVSQAGAVDVTAHQGRVTLSGSIAAHEVEKLLSAVASIAGVTTVVNRLEVNHTTASATSGGNNNATHAGDEHL
jgi:BON domain